jgi:hypothetical protein
LPAIVTSCGSTASRPASTASTIEVASSRALDFWNRRSLNGTPPLARVASCCREFDPIPVIGVEPCLKYLRVSKTKKKRQEIYFLDLKTVAVIKRHRSR